MINTASFDKIRSELEKEDTEREQLIQDSRIVIRDSKKAIYALHRGEVEEAAAIVAHMKNDLSKLDKPGVDLSLHHVAIQEYVEAATFLIFEKEGRIPTAEELGVGVTPYLTGLCDLCGELVRKAIRLVIADDIAGAQKIKDVVEALHGIFLTFHLRNGELRKKSDAIKYHLKKLEEVMYDVHMKKS